MKIKILKILRILAFIPLLLFLGFIVYSGIFGLAFIKDSYATGFEAVLLAIVAGMVGLWWLWLSCILLIILTTVLLRKQRRS